VVKRERRRKKTAYGRYEYSQKKLKQKLNRKKKIVQRNRRKILVITP